MKKGENQPHSKGLFKGIKFLDVLIVSIGLCLIFAGSYSLYYIDSGAMHEGKLNIIAEVDRLKLNPKRKINGALNWNSLKVGQKLYRGDYVVTDELSEVNVKFTNDSYLKIPPNSLVKIDYVGNSIEVELVKGLVNLDLSGLKSKVILTKGNKRYELDGQNGKVEIRSDGDKLDFSSNSKIKVSEIDDKGKKDILIKKELVSFIYPQGKVLRPLDMSAIKVRLKGVKKAKKYKFELLSAREKVLSSRVLTGKELEKESSYAVTKAGSYTLKLLDTKGTFIKSSNFKVEGLPVVTFSEESLLPKRTVKPGGKTRFSWVKLREEKYVVEFRKDDGAVVEKKIENNSFAIKSSKSYNVSFRVKLDRDLAPWSKWNKQDVLIDSFYARNDDITKDEIFLDSEQRRLEIGMKPSKPIVFEIAKDSSFKKIVYSLKRKKKNYMVVSRNFKTGRYFWRVREEKDRFKKTPHYPLRVYARNVTFKKNKQKRVFAPDQKKRIKVSWKERDKKMVYTVTVKDKKTGKVIVKKKAQGTWTKFNVKKYGSYEVVVSNFKKNEDLIDSVPLQLDIDKVHVALGLTPKDIMLQRKHRLGLSRHIIPLPKMTSEDHKKLHVEVFETKASLRPVYKGSTSKRSLVWKTKRSGQYFYRLRVENEKGYFSDYSSMKKMTFPISPFFVTPVRIPAGKKKFYKFPYIVKKGDDLSTILKNYTKASAVVSNLSPTVQQIIKKNKKVKNWNSLRPGRKINVYIETHLLDKSFLYIYKKLFVVKG